MTYVGPIDPRTRRPLPYNQRRTAGLPFFGIGPGGFADPTHWLAPVNSGNRQGNQPLRFLGALPGYTLGTGATGDASTTPRGTAGLRADPITKVPAAVGSAVKATGDAAGGVVSGAESGLSANIMQQPLIWIGAGLVVVLLLRK